MLVRLNKKLNRPGGRDVALIMHMVRVLLSDGVPGPTRSAHLAVLAGTKASRMYVSNLLEISVTTQKDPQSS